MVCECIRLQGFPNRESSFARSLWQRSNQAQKVSTAIRFPELKDASVKIFDFRGRRGHRADLRSQPRWIGVEDARALHAEYVKVRAPKSGTRPITSNGRWRCRSRISMQRAAHRLRS